MITVFNRRGLVITMDFNKQAEVRGILTANEIPYVTKTINLQSSQTAGYRSGRTGNPAINQKNAYEYRIFVHKKDYDKAAGLIHAVL